MPPALDIDAFIKSIGLWFVKLGMDFPVSADFSRATVVRAASDDSHRV